MVRRIFIFDRARQRSQHEGFELLHDLQNYKKSIYGLVARLPARLRKVLFSERQVDFRETILDSANSVSFLR